MSNHQKIHTDIAESIMEHAKALTRLDAAGMEALAYDAAVARHVGAMRLVAISDGGRPCGWFSLERPCSHESGAMPAFDAKRPLAASCFADSGPKY